jgi:putative lipoic acid-binding regulatory protein
MSKKMDSRFEKLNEQLEELEWPAVYYFKFIAPNEPKMIALVTQLFNSESDINMRPSRKGNYTSINIKEVMVSAAAVIEIYKEAAKIKGLISL